MTTCRDRLFKATYPQSPKKDKNVFHPSLDAIQESSSIGRIESKEDAGNAVKELMNSSIRNRK